MNRSNIQLLRDDFDRLKKQGDKLSRAFARLAQKNAAVAVEGDSTTVHFEYDNWYTEALAVVRQLVPDRHEDFVSQYKQDKRKKITTLTFTISDFLQGVVIYDNGKKINGEYAAAIKMKNQLSIFSSVEVSFTSKIIEIKEILQADLFDSELAAATELLKKGFLRGAGAIAGVVLESHLSNICFAHSLNSRKKYPTISTYNDLLKTNNIIEVPQWRNIQLLGDLRNMCDHATEKSPTKDDVIELINGTNKIVKTIF